MVSDFFTTYNSVHGFSVISVIFVNTELYRCKQRQFVASAIVRNLSKSTKREQCPQYVRLGQYQCTHLPLSIWKDYLRTASPTYHRTRCMLIACIQRMVIQLSNVFLS